MLSHDERFEGRSGSGFRMACPPGACFRLRRWGSVGLGVAFLAGAVSASALAALTGIARSAAPETTRVAALKEYPNPEIPREWRWQPRAVKFEHMYQTRR